MQQQTATDPRLEAALDHIPNGAFRDRARTQFLAVVKTSTYASPELRPGFIRDAASVLASHLRSVRVEEDVVRATIVELCGTSAYVSPALSPS